MNEYLVRNSLPNIFIHNKLLICGRMIGWETQDSRQGLGLYRLISSHMILIWYRLSWAVLWGGLGTGPP